MHETELHQQSNYRLAPWIVLMLSLLTIGGITAIDLHSTSAGLIERESARLTHAAEVVETTLARRLQSTHNALDAIAPDLRDLLDQRMTREEANHRLESLVSAMVGVRTLLLADASGTVLASNRPLLLEINFHEDERYRTIRTAPKPDQLYVSQPFVTPHGVLTITLGKAVMDHGGNFTGYAVAALDPEYFNSLLKASLYAKDMRVLLIHGAGKVIHSLPDDVIGFDLRSSPDSLFNRHLQGGERRSLTSGVTASTQEHRIAAFYSITPSHSTADFPLVVALSRELGSVYAPWHRDAIVRSLLFGALSLFSVSGLWLFQRHQRRNEKQLVAEEAERRKLESALVADRQSLAEVVWGTDAGTWEWNLQTGAVRFNERWAGLLGYTLEELAPTSIDTWRTLTHPDDLKMLECQLAELVPGRIEFFESKIRMRHKDGHWIWILDRGRAVERDAQGTALRLAGAHLDISAAQAAEIRTLAALRYARSLLEASLDPIMTIGLDGRIMDVNEAAENLTGLARSELVGRDFAGCFTDPVKARDGCQRVFADGRVRDLPLALKHVDGSVTEVLYNASIFRDEDERVAGAFAAARDITPFRTSQRQLERTNAEGQMLRQMSDLLQSCQSVLEGVPVIQAGLQELFPGAHGRILLMNSTGELLEEVSRWGRNSDTAIGTAEINTMAPGECWALRRNHVHDSGFEHSINPRCPHLMNEPRPCLCLPLQAQGQPLGIITLIPEGDIETLQHARQLAETVADSLSLSLANLRLRENLQTLSMRDPLTGLYNRRFMEEGLERELNRAARTHCPLAVAMLDLDHFKSFNDNYGHDAGDAVLTAFAKLMLGFRTGSDIACRYGGEEFLLVLTGIDRTQAEHRIDDFRHAVSQLSLHQHGQVLPNVTVSIGVALFPDHGRHAAALIKAADQALYVAKNSGRNLVAMADP
jgi:diguanylate cyclase (GGDEF)-like protein/PAS domain S-box-containing protein